MLNHCYMNSLARVLNRCTWLLQSSDRRRGDQPGGEDCTKVCPAGPQGPAGLQVTSIHRSLQLYIN